MKGAVLLYEWAGRHPGFLALLGHFLWQARQEGEPLAVGLSEFTACARLHLNECFIALPAHEKIRLADVLNGARLPMVSTLNQRGWLDNDQPFGKVLTWWWRQRG